MQEGAAAVCRPACGGLLLLVKQHGRQESHVHLFLSCRLIAMPEYRCREQAAAAAAPAAPAPGGLDTVQAGTEGSPVDLITKSYAETYPAVGPSELRAQWTKVLRRLQKAVEVREGVAVQGARNSLLAHCRPFLPALPCNRGFKASALLVACTKRQSNNHESGNTAACTVQCRRLPQNQA
jgi:hypothetical protein